MRLLRLLGIGGQWQSRYTLLAGLLLGCILTSTFTLRSWWNCNGDLWVDRGSRKFSEANMNIKTRSNVNLHNTFCKCPQQTQSTHPFTPVPDSRSVFKSSHKDISSYLNPKEEQRTYKFKTLNHLSQEYQLKEKLLIAVITSEDHLKMANSVYDTWGGLAQQLIFFVGRECNTSNPTAAGLPLVRLPTVGDLPINSIEKVFGALEYIASNYLEAFHWVMFASDNMYVRVNRLESLLMKFDSSSNVYLGRPGNGRNADLDKLSLLAHERYCLGSTGVVLSAGLINSLTPYLQLCLSAAVSQAGSGDGNVWVWSDVELGRCVSRMAGTQCSQSQEVKDYFIIDYSGHPLTLPIIEQAKKQFDDLITYHPINEPMAMRLIHYHYTKQNFRATLDRAHQDEVLSNEACSEVAQIPDYDISPEFCTASLCPCDRDGRVGGKCPAMGVVNEPSKPYQPISIYDYQPWQYFNDRTLFDDRFIHPDASLRMHKDIKKELQVMLNKAVQSANDMSGKRLKFKQVVNGWVRHNPFRGSEYIVDCLFVDSFKRVVPKRVSLVRPLAANYLTLKENYDPQTAVHFIVPLANVNARFTEFMIMYEDIAFKTSQNVHLILAVYGDQDHQFVKDAIGPFQQQYPTAMVTVLKGDGEFSRGKALDLGMTQLHPEDLAFMCDVDMSVSQDFIDRCRKNTIRGQRVYYPEFFKLYNMDYVYGGKGGKYPKSIAMKRQHGHWAYYSFGMLCIFKSDYRLVGGMNTNIKGWGEEDVTFFEKVVRKKLDVFRAPDTGLSHRWHEKTCPTKLSPTQHAHCLTSRGENLADRIELANYIYALDVQLKYEGQGDAHKAQLSQHTIETASDNELDGS